jgi:hypothetical protein
MPDKPTDKPERTDRLGKFVDDVIKHRRDFYRHRKYISQTYLGLNEIILFFVLLALVVSIVRKVFHWIM